jgi:putative phosphoribosyl transferase
MLFRDEDDDFDVLPFANREQAGQMLAGRLMEYARQPDAIALGLPRGGVVLASVVAVSLQLPLDVLLVCKMGRPWQLELVVGALAEGNVEGVNLSMLQSLYIRDKQLREMADAARERVKIQARLYRGRSAPLSLAGKHVILVDHGIATGCRMLAGIEVARRRQAAHIVVAVPVLPACGSSAIWMEADEVISVAEPEMVEAISQCYQHFDQLTDDDVKLWLEAAAVVPRAA